MDVFLFFKCNYFILFWSIVDLCVCVCSVTQSCLTLCHPMDCSPPDSSVYGIFQARIPEWVAISSPRGSSQHRDQTLISFSSCDGKQILYHWAIGKWSDWKQSLWRRILFLSSVFHIKHLFKKLCYIYTMEYYSAIKRNAFESVLMRWMKLEPIIQSEVSQKEKHPL